jgi:hypothetical protein
VFQNQIIIEIIDDLFFIDVVVDANHVHEFLHIGVFIPFQFIIVGKHKNHRVPHIGTDNIVLLQYQILV